MTWLKMDRVSGGPVVGSLRYVLPPAVGLSENPFKPR